MCDRMSGYPFAKELKRCGTNEVTEALGEWFLDKGYPERLRCDFGPAFRQGFGNWCEMEGIKWERSSSYFPQSNGLAEAAVARVKKCIERAKKSGEPIGRALAELRLCPMRGMTASPAELFYGRQMRGQLPQLKRKMKLKENLEKREIARSNYSKRRGTRKHRSEKLKAGQRITLQDEKTGKWDREGVIKKPRNNSRSYEILLDDGSKVLRNTRFLRKARPRDVNDESTSHMPLPQRGESQSREASGASRQDKLPAQPRRSLRQAARRRVHFGAETEYSL